MNISEALHTLDPKNDEHWTSDGLPKLGVVEGLVGRRVKRQEVTDADPEFTRDTAPELTDGKEVVEDAGDDEARPDADDVGASAEASVTEEDEPEQEAASTLPPRPHDDLLTRLEKQLELDTETIAKLREEMAERQKKLDAVNNRAVQVSTRIDALKKVDPHAQTRGIRAYLETQNRLRMERAGRRQAFLKGLDDAGLAGDVDAKSAIDKAMNQRKPQRGAARPERPLMGGKQE